MHYITAILNIKPETANILEPCIKGNHGNWGWQMFSWQNRLQVKNFYFPVCTRVHEVTENVEYTNLKFVMVVQHCML